MGWVSGLFALLKAIPDFLRLGKEIMTFLHSISDYWERKNKLGELKDAVKEAREKKDTSKLEAIFNPR
jgi:hypothetical protein